MNDIATKDRPVTIVEHDEPRLVEEPIREPRQLPVASRPRSIPVSFWWAVGSLVLMVVGATGPWVKVLGLTISGTDDSRDGWLVLGAAVIGAVLLIGYFFRRRRWPAVVAIVIGAISGVVAGYDIADTNNVASQFGNEVVSTEWGIYLSLVSSISLALASLTLVLRTRRRQAEAPGAPAVERSVDRGSRGQRVP